LRYDLYAALAGLTAQVLNVTASGGSPEARIQEWAQANATSIARTRNAIGEIDESKADLAALSVLLRQIRTLVQVTT
jgi:glutamate dehydrogenase